MKPHRTASMASAASKTVYDTPQFVAIWAFTDSENDVRLFTKSYQQKPTESQVKSDAFRQYKRLGVHGHFNKWLAGLSQTGEVKVITTQTSGVESILREFVGDVQAVGVSAVRGQMDWPDLAVTYEKAVRVIGGK